MSVFENFPYTNFHNLNLDWVLNKLKSFEERLNKIETNGGGAGGGTGGGTGGGSSIDVTALEAKIAAKQDKLTFDTEPTRNSDNPVTSGGVYTAIDSATTTLNNSLDHINNDLESKIADKQDKLTFDTAPTQNSNNPVTSGGVYTAIDNIKGGSTFDPSELEAKIADKQDKLTFDSTPKQNSNNPVTSGGIYKAIDGNSTKVNCKVYGGPKDDNGNPTGYTLTNDSYVQITTDSIINLLRPNTIPVETITSVSIAIQIQYGLIAQACRIGVFNFRNRPADGHYFASCYHNPSNSILNFDISLSDDGMRIRLIAPSDFGSDTLHIDEVVIELAYQDNIIVSGVH